MRASSRVSSGNWLNPKARTPAAPQSHKQRNPTLSTLQPIIPDSILRIDLDVNTLDRTALTQVHHPASNSRTAHAKFPRKPLPIRPDKSGLRIKPSLQRFQNPLTDVKRNARRSPPWIPRRPMCPSHFTLLSDSSSHTAPSVYHFWDHLWPLRSHNSPIWVS